MAEEQENVLFDGEEEVDYSTGETEAEQTYTETDLKKEYRKGALAGGGVATLISGVTGVATNVYLRNKRMKRLALIKDMISVSNQSFDTETPIDAVSLVSEVQLALADTRLNAKERIIWSEVLGELVKYVNNESERRFEEQVFDVKENL